MLHKSLIISYSTPNYKILTDNFLSSLYELNIDRKNINHKLDIIDKELMKNTGFMTDLFYYCIIQKVKNVIDKLYENKNKYEYYISSDCDIWFFKNKDHFWNELEDYIVNNDYALTFMREDRTELINGGFFIISNKYLNNSIIFLERVYELLLNTPRHEIPFLEQTIINNIKNEINFGFIPNEYVIWGNVIYNKEKSLFHHAVCCNDTEDKITQINEIKKIFYKNSPLPEKFNFIAYRILNNFNKMKDDDIIYHWFNNGRYNGLEYKLPDNFNYYIYRIANNVLDWNDEQIEWHWLNHGRHQGWEYKLPDNFNYNVYKIINNVFELNNTQIEYHWFNNGRYNRLEYKLPDDFNYDTYRKLNNVNDWNNEQIDWHWLNHGKYQGYNYK